MIVHALREAGIFEYRECSPSCHGIGALQCKQSLTFNLRLCATAEPQFSPGSWSWNLEEVTCMECWVQIDRLMDRGMFFVRPDKTYHWPDEPEYEGIALFADFLREEERDTYSAEELQKVARAERMPVRKVREALLPYFKLEERPKGKMEYNVKMGGTFGWAGLKR